MANSTQAPCTASSLSRTGSPFISGSAGTRLVACGAGLDPAAGMDEVVVEEFVQALVGTGLADEKEVRPEVEDQPAQGLAAVQVVAEKDRPVGA